MTNLRRARMPTTITFNSFICLHVLLHIGTLYIPVSIPGPVILPHVDCPLL